jgi:Na+/proline symporter
MYRAHAARFVVAGCALSWTVIGGIVAVCLGSIVAGIWCAMASMLLALIALVELRACDQAHTRYIRSLKPKPPGDYRN